VRRSAIEGFRPGRLAVGRVGYIVLMDDLVSARNSDRPDALSFAADPVRTWFSEAFEGPTGAQTLGWPPIASGRSTLLLAPTGSGKTLAALLAAIDRLMFHLPADAPEGVRVLYVSPLKALGVDVERNLRTPLAGVRAVAERTGAPYRMPSVGVRTGDTPAAERRDLVRHPPDILITTPESLYLMLTSRARETLRTVETVIVDEIHAVAATKRGVHLALSLERLEWERRLSSEEGPVPGSTAPRRARPDSEDDAEGQAGPRAAAADAGADGGAADGAEANR
jgi:ATP-dependent Lhr-like helicase